MNKRIVVFTLTIAAVFAGNTWSRSLAASRSASPTPAVVLLMLDGVRWQEVFNGLDPALSNGEKGAIFSDFTQVLGAQGTFYGNRTSGSSMTVANTAVLSLPAYQSIFSGRTQPCMNNECSRVTEETLQERLLRDLRLDRKDVATIASWTRIAFASESHEGATFVNAGITPLADGTSDDAELNRLNALQDVDRPNWGDARSDRHTMAQALHYLKKWQPRFLYISLNDPDEWGHRGDYRQYVATLKQDERWIRDLVNTIDEMDRKYGRETTLLVTTDHGRGNGENWRHHGTQIEGAEFIWLYKRNPGGQVRGKTMGKPGLVDQRLLNHLDIRPTIEAALGLEPRSCEDCGSPLPN